MRYGISIEKYRFLEVWAYQPRLTETLIFDATVIYIVLTSYNWWVDVLFLLFESCCKKDAKICLNDVSLDFWCSHDFCRGAVAYPTSEPCHYHDSLVSWPRASSELIAEMTPISWTALGLPSTMLVIILLVVAMVVAVERGKVLNRDTTMPWAKNFILG